MTGYNRGDVVLVGFIFTDETGIKRRPALVISSDSYHKGRDEAIISAITSNTDRILEGDYLISDWKGAGLLFPSVATGIIRTIKTNMIDRKLGAMPHPDMETIERQLRLILDL
jgi:mRNA interferase MazF